MTWERARSEDQIEHRIKEIVDATARLYENTRYEDITFSMIAKEASFTRSNLYRYFKTKEEIFLALLAHDIANWQEEILASFPKTQISVFDFAEQWVGLLLKQHRLIEIYTILYTMLEPNASLEALVTFKKNMMITLSVVIDKLTVILPLSAEAAREFLVTFIAIAIGIYPSMNPTSKQLQAMEIVKMNITPEFHKAAFIHSIESILNGLIQTDN